MFQELFLALALVAANPVATPQSELAAALADVQTVPVVDILHYRYLTLYATDRVDVEKTLNFWVNSLSSKRVLKLPVKVGPTLFRVDIRDYGWTPESWNAVAIEDPYYKGANGGIIVRGDWFIIQTSDGTRSQAYYKLLYGLGKEPKNAEDFKKRWAVDLGKAREQRAEVGAVIDSGDSIVALHNRIIAQVRTVNGHYWQSFDAVSDEGVRNALENLGGSFKFDAQEHIVSLPNGLHAYLLSDAKGARLEFADPAIAKDATAHKRPTVDNPVSCVRCHGKSDGLHPPRNKLQELLVGGGLAIANDKNLQEYLEGFYLTDDGQEMRDAQRNYAKQVMYLTGFTGKVNAEKLARVVRWYDQKVTLDQACIELGVTKDQLTHAVKSLVLIGKDDRNGQLVALVTLGEASRGAWEANIFKKAQALLAVTK